MGICTYSKHAKLITACYPKSPAEKGPKPSELSYLTFYASSRPAKLLKVGRYLERKVARDTVKERVTDNQVSLDILKGLMKECKRDLNLFSGNIVNVLLVITGSLRMKALWPRAADIFTFLVQNTDKLALSVDTQFAEACKQVLSIFCRLALDSDEKSASASRLVGLKAVYAVAQSEILDQEQALLQAALGNLFGGSLETIRKRAAEGAKVPDPMDEGITEEEITAEDTELLALDTVRVLFGTHDANRLQRCLKVTMDLMDTRDTWWPATFAVELSKVILQSLQAQHSYLLVLCLLDRLENAPILSPKQASLSRALANVLHSSSFPGLSIPEATNALINVLLSLPGEALLSPELHRPEDVSGATLAALIEAVGGLAAHVYSDNQVGDVVGHLVGRMLASQQHEMVLIWCLEEVAKASAFKEGGEEAPALGSWAPTVPLLKSRDPAVREKYIGILRLLCGQKHSQTGCTMDGFSRAFHQVVLELVPIGLPRDWVGVAWVLGALMDMGRGEAGAAGVMPLAFKLQESVRNEGAERQAVVQSVVAEVLEYVADALESRKLKEYVAKVKAARVERGQWVELKALEQATGWEGIQAVHPVDTLFEQDDVANALKSDSKLKDSPITVETLLNAKFGERVDLYRRAQIRSSIVAPIVEAGRLATPLPEDGFAKEAAMEIGVESLRDALGGGENATAGEFERKVVEMDRTESVEKLLEMIDVRASSSVGSLASPPYRSA
ncbi:uncharacterized protein VTP21DRAFT_10755 [Calcarisporiella thermophila]|uniref:uncharacterized protein n=1 Tax=Calcarisporiella thermophila TaxID=911321 RepID=UPI003742FAF6